MEQQVLLKNGADLVYLTACALRGETPDAQRVEAMDLDAVYALARKHSMGAVSAYAIESYRKANENTADTQLPVVTAWLQEKPQAIRKNLMLDMEREKILARLEKMGCWYMPLKGVFLQQLYPRAGMRQMSDNDILIDPAFRMAVAEYMRSNGYEAETVGKYIHDEFLKEPVYNFEMHVALIPKEHSGPRADYYKQIMDKLIKDPGNRYGYHFTDEDFYIYMTAHAAKHYESSGNGIRSLMDTFVYLRQKGANLDRGYIDRELNALDLYDYERTIVSLANKLFGTGEALSQEDEALFLYHISAGTYGNWSTLVDNRLKKVAGDGNKITLWVKVKYILYRLFPPVEFYEDYAPLAYRYRILIPFAAVYRIISRAVFSAPRFWGEAKRIWTGKSRKNKDR